MLENTPQLQTDISKPTLLQDIFLLEDGPLFRATLKQLEDRTASLKTSLKRIIKSATVSIDLHKQVFEADESYIEALRTTQCVQPLINCYLNNIWNVIRQERQKLDESLSTQILEPLKRFYESNVKIAESKRHQFEEESKEYYASLAKYLKNATNKRENFKERQRLHIQRKSKFDLARFDYICFLSDMHGGMKESEILFSMADHVIRDVNYFESVATKIENQRPALNDLVSFITKSAEEQEISHHDRIKKRNELVKICNTPACTTNDMNQLSKGEKAIDLVKFNGIHDLAEKNNCHANTARRKEGFLFATSKPSKSTGFDVSSTSAMWHKYWCVVSGGKLHEYSNWKRLLEPHITPIDLKFATVREARNEERRFCFEVITPQLRRVYQATSQEEAQYWIETIQNSIAGVLTGTATSVNLPGAKKNYSSLPNGRSKLKQHGRSLSEAFKSGFAAVATLSSSNSSSLNGMIPSSSHSISILKDHKRRSTNNPPISIPNRSQPLPLKPSEAIELLASSPSSYTKSDRVRLAAFGFKHQHRSAPNINETKASITPQKPESNNQLLSMLKQEPSNNYCADCGTQDPDWCSINLGILLCIECSGIHRGLGTHVSKIRSLTLDTTAFTPDIIELLKSVGNAKSNSIWDPLVVNETKKRPSPTDTRAAKSEYIQAKYVQREFVVKDQYTSDDTSSVDKILFSAIKHDDIVKALYALATGANVNSSLPVSIANNGNKDIQESPSDMQAVYSKYIPFLHTDNDNDTKVSSPNEQEYVTRYALHYALHYGRKIGQESSLLSGISLSSVKGPSLSSTAGSNPDSMDIINVIPTTMTKDEDSPISSFSSSNSIYYTPAMSNTNNSLSTLPKNRKFVFPVAELLLQNGANTDIVNPQTGLSIAGFISMDYRINDDAIAYINMKSTARGQPAITRFI
ncbi:MAG: hypothetical protein EXX96DRAFT_533979 [Benjaminiella poitrasii]|nr:MAG: hypothetical protein EXX96DRAFT_533979 [Benjaminiella poitrasii]